MEELEKAHFDYLKRKNEIVTKLITIRDFSNLKDYEKEWINQSIAMLEEKEI